MSKVGFISLGCPKATVDSERILTQLKSEGYEISQSYDESDLVIVNTCGFIEDAVQESLDTIGEALTENGKVIVTGCLGANAQDITQVHPQVLAVSGPAQYETVMQQVHDHLPKPEHDPFLDLVPPQGVKLTPRHYAYLKISEGCNHHCTFCIIPSMRGKLVSRSVVEVMNEAERLVDVGVNELLVVSQDTSAFGMDVKHKTEFWDGIPIKNHITDLAKHLGTLGAWVRLHYVYPYPHVDELLPLMADGLILPYLDMPLQHAHPRVLKAMKRPGEKDRLLERLHRWREQVPDLTLRSTFIVGFPGETEAEFETLLDFIDQAQLDRVGCFPYSPVEGAAANALSSPVPDTIKAERYQIFMAKQQAISEQRLKNKIGHNMTVIVDGLDEDSQQWICRSPADAPEIDGQVYVTQTIHKPIDIGQRIEVKIYESDEYDLYGNMV